jgi:hypothetical protein
MSVRFAQQPNPAASDGRARIGSFSNPRGEDPVEGQYAAMNAQTERIIEGKWLANKVGGMRPFLSHAFPV